MPAKKKTNTRNGFYWFMQDIIPDLQREGRVFPGGMPEIVTVALPRWKNLPEAERDRYEKIAKEKKKKNRGPSSNEKKYDNVGNVIAEREDPAATESKRRLKERKIARSRWPAGQRIKEEKFYFISIEYLCRTEDGHYLPCEIGMVEWSMTAGITKTWHKFMRPTRIPLGYRFTCQQHSDDTHQIPIEKFELADGNYLGIWNQMKNFINPGSEKKEYPPIYCMAKDMQCVEYCSDWIYEHSCKGVGDHNVLHKIYFIEDMVVDLYEHCGAAIAEAEASVLLETSNFDYEMNTTCKWHEEKGIKYCALGTGKRYAYALSDAMCLLKGYEFELTPHHVPTKSDDDSPNFTVVPTSAIYMEPDNRHKDKDWCYQRESSRNSRDVDTSREGPYSSTDIRYRQHESQAASSGFAQFPKPPVADDKYGKDEIHSDYGGNCEEDFGHTVVPNTIVRSATAPGWAPGQSAMAYRDTNAPWSKRAAKNTNIPMMSEEDFPSLGAEKTKFASRAGPPPAENVPKPTAWQGASAGSDPQSLGEVAKLVGGRGSKILSATPGVCPVPGVGRGVTPPAQAGNWSSLGRGGVVPVTVDPAQGRTPGPVWQHAARMQQEAANNSPDQNRNISDGVYAGEQPASDTPSPKSTGNQPASIPPWQLAAQRQAAKAAASPYQSSPYQSPDSRTTLQEAVQQTSLNDNGPPIGRGALGRGSAGSAWPSAPAPSVGRGRGAWGIQPPSSQQPIGRGMGFQ